MEVGNGTCKQIFCSLFYNITYTTWNLHVFYSFSTKFFFLHILVGPTSFVYEKYFIVASTVHSVKHDWFFRLILNRNIFCTMNWECLCFHYFDDRKIFNKFINLSFQLILFSTEIWITLIYIWRNGTLSV